MVLNGNIKKNMNQITKNTTVRDILQQTGTEFGRALSPQIWINSLFSEYKEKKPDKGISVDYMISECIDCKTSFSGEKWQFICNDCYDTHNWLPKWIITDLRFPNELSEIKKRKGVTIRVNRFPKTMTICRGFGDCIDVPFDPKNDSHLLHYKTENGIKHESETALDHIDNWDFVIDNNGSIEELIEQVKCIYDKIKREN